MDVFGFKDDVRMRSCVLAAAYCSMMSGCLLFVCRVPVTEAASVCSDSTLCSYWASQGECEAHPETMLVGCPRACRNPCLCDVSAFTNDTACDCIIRAKSEGYCNTSDAAIACQTTCTKVTFESCPPLPLPVDPNARLSTWSSNYLATVTEVCILGYLPLVDRNQGKKLCSKDGRWMVDYVNGDPVEYSAVDCGRPPSSANAYFVATDTRYGSTVDYVCARGCVPESGVQTLVCNASALWEGQPLTCRRIDCGPPPPIPHTAVTTTSTSLGSQASYSCEHGYTHQHGDTTLTCNSSGVWGGAPISCTAIDCQDPPSLPNTRVQVNATTYSQTANYSCVPGFQHDQGQFTLTCGPSGNWTGDALKCNIVDCGRPPSGDGVTVHGPNTTYGQVAAYSCSLGYTYSSGDFNLTCDLHGNWAGQLMQCTVVDCGRPPSGDGVTVHGPNTTYGQVAAYSCSLGYTYSSGDFNLICDLHGNWAGQLMQCTASHNSAGPPRKSSTNDALIPCLVGVVLFLAFIVVLIVVLISTETLRRNRQLMKTEDAVLKGLKSMFNIHMWSNLHPKTVAAATKRLHPHRNTTKSTPASTQHKRPEWAHLPVASQNLQVTSSPATTRILSPASELLELPGRLSRPTSLNSISFSTSSQSALPEVVL